jgi:hypothetical protein
VGDFNPRSDIQGFANTVHGFRLRGLYVDWRGGALSIPSAAVSTERAQSLIELAEARLGLEKAEELREPTAEGRETAMWFMQVAKQEEHWLIFARGDRQTQWARSTGMDNLA